MEVTSIRPGYELWRPNREKPEAKTMKAIVAFVLLVSAGLLLVITVGGVPLAGEDDIPEHEGADSPQARDEDA